MQRIIKKEAIEDTEQPSVCGGGCLTILFVLSDQCTLLCKLFSLPLYVSKEPSFQYSLIR